MPCISFILPIYNMGSYLPRVLQSLRRQTLPDFEALLVNDGSTDNSGLLCAQAAAQDSRFRFIDQPNGGVAAARNAALDAARGEYVFFLDPDDWIEPDTAEVFYRSAQQADADYVQTALLLDYYDAQGQLLHSSPSLPTISGVYRGHPFQEQIREFASSYLVIGKMFRRSLLEQYHLRFPARQLGEDGLFFIAFYRQDPPCAVVLDRPLYHYTIARKASLSNSYHPERLQDNFYLSSAVWDTVAAWGLLESPLHRQEAYYCTVRDLQMGIKNLGLSPLSTRQRTRWLRQAAQLPHVREAIRKTPLQRLRGRNDKVKLLLLRLHLYSLVVQLSALHQQRSA